MTRSLKHEYAQYLELEIDNYKFTAERMSLMRLADDVVASMAKAVQLELTEIVVNEAVNEEISRRLRLPKYESWRRKRLKMVEQFRRADHWGLSATQHLWDAVRPQDHPHIVVAGPFVEARTLYLAARGAHVTALGEMEDEDLVSRVLITAAQAGLSGQVVGCVDGIDEWAPSVPARAVIWHAHAVDALSIERRRRMLTLLQDVTVAGGVHYIEGVPTEARGTASIRSLIANYPGWQAPVDDGDGVMVLHKPRVA